MKVSMLNKETCVAIATVLVAAGCASNPTKGGSSASVPGDFAASDLAPVLSSSLPRTDAKCPTKPSDLRSVRELASAASTCARAGNWAGTERHASELARRDLTSPWAPYFMSLAAGAAGDAPRALWMAELAQKKAGRDVPLFRYQRGRALLALGRKAEAFGEIQAAADAEPRLVEGRVYVGETLLADQDAPKAEESFRRALAVEPRHLRAQKGFAAARIAQGDATGGAPATAQAAIHTASETESPADGGAK